MAGGGWWLGAALLMLGGASLLAGAGADADTPASPVIEVERWLPAPGGGVNRVTILIDTRLADPEELLASAYPGTLASPEVTAQFTTFGKWAEEDIPVPTAYDSSNDPPGISGAPVLAVAANTWNSVPGQSFSFTGGGPVGVDTPLCGSNDGDGANTVLFSPDLDFGVLGETCALFDDFFTDRIVEFDLHLSSNGIPWSTAPVTPDDAFDVQTVMLHELGHALGLGHSGSGTVMQPLLDFGEQLRTPTADDIAGIQFLYGTGQTPTPTATASPTVTPTQSPTGVPSPTPTPTPTQDFEAVLPAVARD